MKLSEAADRVIELARKVREYYTAELPKRHPHYPLVGLGEEGPPPPREETQLRNFLATLSADLVCRLILIMYLGRGDFSTDQLAEQYQALKSTLSDPEYAASEMMGKAPLADYLLDGLEELRKQNIDVDKLPLKRAKVPKR
ncbi:MAG TPA: DUF3775 domain-containing protein [Gemmataceae bacterium]|nr:DUF3775 domain-containing protein [Gemmataceae bacterium]